MDSSWSILFLFPEIVKRIFTTRPKQQHLYMKEVVWFDVVPKLNKKH